MSTRRILSRRLEQLERREVLSATVFEHDGIAYFLNQSDPGFARYDIAGEEWISPVDLAGATGLPTAAHADSDGLYVAYGKAVYRYGLDGTGQTSVINTQNNVQRIHTDGDLLFVNHSSGLYARVVSLDKTNNTVIDTMDSYIDSIYGSSIDPVSNRIFGRTGGISPADIAYVSYSDTGDLLVNADSPYHGDYPGASQTWVFDDGSKVVDNSGTIYTTGGLQYANSFGGAVTDIDFVGGSVPIVLSGSSLTAYSAGILPTGSATLSGSPTDLFVNDASAIVFEAVDGGWQDTVVPLSSISAPEPGEPVDPVGLPFTIDKQEITPDGTVLLFSQQHASVFRYDPVSQQWGDTIPLVGSPLYMAYSGVNNSIYLAYESGLIRAIDLADPSLEARPFANFPQRPLGLATAGEFVFGADASGAWESHYTFGPDGAMISAVEWNYGARQYTWSEVNRKMYFFRDGTSPNDILWEEIDEFGVIGRQQDSPLHSSAGFTYPIRVAPDGGVAILGSGVIHDAETLARLPQSLANPVTDIAWLGNDTYTIRTVAGGAQLQSWTGSNWGLGEVAQIPGEAVSLTTVGANRLLAVTRDENGVPQMTVLDSAFNLVPQPTPVALAGDDVLVDLGSSTTLDGSASYDPDESPGGLTYSWRVAEGPSGATFGDAAAAMTSFSAEAAGTYRVELTVSDGVYESTDTVVVTYRLNLRPQIDITGSETTGVAERGAISLSAAASTDPNDDPLQFTWEVIAAPEGAAWSLNSSTSPFAYLGTDTPGDYSVRVTASDGVLESSEVFGVSFTENQAPVSDASRSDLTGVAARHPATLNASASSDPEGDALTFLWEVIDGPDLSSVVLSTPTSASATFRSAVAGVYDVRLTVDDGLASDSSVVQVTIAENQKPIADASLSVTEIVYGSGQVRLDGTASTDPDDSSLGYAWRVVASTNGVLPSVSNSRRSVAYFYPSGPGRFGIELTVTDGASSDTDYVIVTVIGNQAPTADASASDSVVFEGSHARLDGSHSADPDGDPLAYEWTVVASSSETAPVITDPTAVTTRLTRPEVGTHLVKLAVSDSVDIDEDFVLLTVRERLQHPWTGDFNGDGWVDLADYTVWRDGINTEVAPYTHADATGDGWIDMDDYEMWRQASGSNPGATASAAQVVAAGVSEDTGTSLAAVEPVVESVATPSVETAAVTPAEPAASRVFVLTQPAAPLRVEQSVTLRETAFASPGNAALLLAFDNAVEAWDGGASADSELLEISDADPASEYDEAALDLGLSDFV